jgi:hypothetical protein
MTAVDLTAFIEKLADVAGQTILPFFRTTFGAEDKSGGGVFDPGNFFASRHHRRGIRQ